MNENMTYTYKLSDGVLHRIIQILQEAMLLNIDVADLMRQIELRASDDDSSKLVLTHEYEEMIVAWHKKLVDDAEKLQSERETTKKGVLLVD